MNIKPLIDAIDSLDNALVSTFVKSERSKIVGARKAMAKVLQSRGVFLQPVKK